MVDARPGASADGDTELDVRRLIDDLDTKSPADVGRRALADDLLRGDLVSEDGTVAAIVVFFDERRVDEVRGAGHRGGPRRRDPPPAADFRAYFNGSLEISETYNRITLANQTKFMPPILVLTRSRDLPDVPIVAADAADARARCSSASSGRSGSTT